MRGMSSSANAFPVAGPEAPERFTVGASGMTFSCLGWGPADGPLALCLHGYPDTAWTWRYLGPHLAERGWRVVAPFMRGYAPTDLAPDGGYEVGALATDAADLHRALGGDERAVLVGHDWGAVAAYAVGSWRPELFSRMVTISVPPLPVFLAPLIRPQTILADHRVVLGQLRLSWYTVFQQLPGISERRLPSVIAKLWADWSPGYDGREDLAHVAEALQGPGRRTAALRYYRALAQPWYRKPAYADAQSHLLGLPEVPLLYLHGRRDGCALAVHAERTAERIGELPAGSEVEILEGVGHFLQLERPEQVNPRIADHLDAGR